ncbi:MAG TPA: hypothetical protein DGT23_33110 [Micromonosporaceae bacterium]|nr:hypothetical protein [Micromonosporaceae bacterium]
MVRKRSEGFLAVGDVAAMPLPGGGFGVCQVGPDLVSETASEAGLLTAYTLEWVSAAMPALDDLAAAGVETYQQQRWDGSWKTVLSHDVICEDHPPADFVWLGNQPLRPGISATLHSYAGWESLRYGVAFRNRARELGLSRVEPISGDADTTVMVDLGAEPVRMSRRQHRLDVPGDVGVPPDGLVRWEGLDVLSGQRVLSWKGPDRGLAAALESRPSVQELHWHDPPTVVDLRGTQLRELHVDSNHMGRILLSSRLWDLHLVGDACRSAVQAHRDGALLELTVHGSLPVIPLGLKSTRRLRLQGLGELDAATPASLGGLEVLEIHFSGVPGRITNAGQLTRLQQLHTLVLRDAYGLEADDLPEAVHWPALRRLHITGLRSSVAAGLKARFRKSSVEITLRGAKSDLWIAANLTNPLRDWADDEPKFGAQACKAYATALKDVERLRANGKPAVTDVRDVLHKFVEDLNRIDKRYGMIDTLRREEACDAAIELAERSGVDSDTASEWIDQWRDW